MPAMQIREEPLGTWWYVLMWIDCLACNVARAGELEYAKREALAEWEIANMDAKTVRRSHVFG